MADERYEWLDRDAAERLLRGETVEAADERARTEAARLLAALESATDPGYRYDDGELPGEAAAMAAFRKARADVGASAGTSLGTVRVAPDARPGRGTGLARPLRFGIAAALAGCAIGGVAVAAGSGVLPTFDDDRPTPASSVSAASTPGPLGSPTQSVGGTGSHSRSPGATGTPPGLPPVDSATPSPTDTGNATPGGPVDDGGATQGGDGSARKGDLYRKTVEACRDYRSGRIAEDRKRTLEATAKGATRVERFCDELLGSDSADGGAGDADSSGGSGGDNGEGDNDGGDGDKDSGGSGDGDRDAGGDDLPQAPATPQVSWSLVPAPSAAVTPSVTSTALSLSAVVQPF
ncbi:hypothetical protein [Streptomyces xantholiticus]|uniref:hypothetical protein n=1 Tax=Streptomyces xantholiticus TaxID=68285 RepID=UPI00167757D4|nr:hypothetical protein [Streptomyces xantholiticus]GGW42933.1 hypothetical protein GCM10010381_29810 [Streptomyces xantholiticus]